MPELRRVERRDGFEAWEVDLHGHQVVYRDRRRGPAGGARARDGQLLAALAPVAMRLGRAPHGDRAGPGRPRRLGDPARRLLPRSARDRHPRPAVRDRSRARDDRRSLARRRRRDGLLLAVPAAGGAPRAGLERRPRARGLAAAALGRPARRLRADLARGRRRASRAGSTARAPRCASAASRARRPAAGDRPRAAAARRGPARARRSCTRCAR